MPKISELTTGSLPAGTETIPFVQSGTTRKISINQILNTLNSTRAIPLTAFGVVANGVTDDTAAVNAAIAYANANSGNITFLVPRGTTKITTTTPILVNSVYFRGECGRNACQINYSGTPAFQWGTTGTFPIFGGISSVYATGPASAGTFIYARNCGYLEFDDLFGNNIDTLLTMGSTGADFASLIYVNNCYIICSDVTTAAMLLVQHGAGLLVTDVDALVTPGTVKDAISITADNAFDTGHYIGGSMGGFDHILRIAANNGQFTGNFFVNDCVMDSMGNGMLLTANAGGTVINIVLNGGAGWLTGSTSSDGYGVKMTGAGTVEFPVVRDILINNFKKGGIFCDVTNLEGATFENLQLFGNNTTAGVNHGIDLLGGAGYKGVNISGVSMADGASLTQFDTGIKIRAAIDHLRVANNDAVGSVANYDGMAAGTTNTFAHTNYRQFGNIGLMDATLHSMQILKGTAIPAGGTAGSGYLVSSTTNFGVFFGSSAPTLSAAKGSLYLRSDGTGVNDRAYINTNGTTTWTAIVTVA